MDGLAKNLRTPQPVVVNRSGVTDILRFAVEHDRERAL